LEARRRRRARNRSIQHQHHDPKLDLTPHEMAPVVTQAHRSPLYISNTSHPEKE
jgi:hypothetical protein